MIKLIHITSPENALSMISEGAYCTGNNPGHYDAGMNFLGVLGEYKNTQPKKRGALVHCEWHGKVSAPFSYDQYNYHTPDILFDFNGSGLHYRNNDPRYFLPYGSSGLIVKEVELEKSVELEALVQLCVSQKNCLYSFFHKLAPLQNYLSEKGRERINKLNKRLVSQVTTISVRRKN